MRNKIQLYIEGSLADLDDGSFLLLNYTAEDLSNPTIVKNSFSRQITLKGTPRNDAIFGHIYRNDRNTVYGSPYIGPNFDPCRKTSFTIQNEMGEILETGYLKLDEITTARKRREYKVTLFGSLGSFIYGLSYQDDGSKRSLADLDFGTSLDFTINRGTVQSAWNRLEGDTSQSAKWDIINFAPCYNGKPTKPFDANKCIIHAATAGLPDKDGEFSTNEGLSLVTLDSEVTEQEAKDYRSYLQRPIIKMSKIIEAIANPSNNGGWSVILDPAFFTNSNPYWTDTWLTLPTMQELNLDIVSANGNFTVVSAPYTYTIPSGGNLSTEYSINFNICPDFGLPAGTTGDFVLHCEDDWAAGMQDDESPGYYLNYIQITITVYASDDSVLDTITFRVSTAQPPSYFPQMDFILDYIDAATGNGYKGGELFTFPVSMTQYGANKVKIEMSTESIAWGHLRGSVMPDTAWPFNDYDAQDGVALTVGYVRNETVFAWQYISSSTARTGAAITKSALLSGEHTPADYLLSFCKMFGLQMVCNKDAKIIEILRRDSLYNGGTVDINGRIDRGREISKRPFAFDSRWYLFESPSSGDFAEYYSNKYGRPFGQFRLNTGYGFDAAEKRMTDGIVFQGGCEVLETSKFFCNIDNGGVQVPAVLLGGGKQTLYKGGETKEIALPQYPAAIKSWLNPSYPMHDEFPKLQVHGADNAHIDSRDTLVFFFGFRTISSNHFTLSDDTRQMLQLNGNNPCWMPGYCDYLTSWKLAKIPMFSRYVKSGTNITRQLDWGTPVEIQIPGVSVVAASNIFSQYWERYIGDRYDDDSSVVTAWVDLRGMRVDETLLRKFYAFDGAIWALNRIIDHSLTTFGPTKCEFVKVQAISNYTTL